MLEPLIDESDYEWLMIYHIYKGTSDAAIAKGASQDMGRTKEGLTQRYIWPWIAHGTLAKMVIPIGTAADYAEACALVRELISLFAGN